MTIQEFSGCDTNLIEPENLSKPTAWNLEDAREDFMFDVYNTLEFLPTNNAANEIIDIFDRVLRDELITTYSMAYDFAEWVANEIFSDDWEFNKNSFEEIACRKLVKLGIVEEVDEKYRLKNEEE